MASVAAQSVALAITAYQQFVSPHKGFCCAHRYLNGGLSCSQAVKRLVLNHGLIESLPLVRARFEACRNAYKLLLAQATEEKDSTKNETEPGECPVFTKDFWKDKKTWKCCDSPVLGACWPF